VAKPVRRLELRRAVTQLGGAGPRRGGPTAALGARVLVAEDNS